MKKKSYFGPHLMLDLSECDQERINDLDFIFNFLNTLPDKIGMVKNHPALCISLYGNRS